MRTLLLAPHADDESLFAAYTAQRLGAHVAVVYNEGRSGELARACSWLGCSFEQLSAHKGMRPSVVHAAADHLRARDWDLIVAPAAHEFGHGEHNTVADMTAMFHPTPVIRYLTYAPRGQRDRSGVEVRPERPEFIARKLAALSCYRSQIAEESTRPWFYELLNMREWIEQ